MTSASRSGEALLVARDLTKHFDVSPPLLARLLAGERRRWLRAVDGVSFSLPAGRTLGLVGESGCGKSTVARCIAGLYAPTSGSVTYRGTPISEIAAGRANGRRDVQMIFQDPYASLNPRWKVRRIIADPILAQGLAASRGEVADAVAALVDDVGLPRDAAEKYPHEFSGGQRQRIAIARALASRPALIVADEPTSALDVSVQAQILNLMRDLQEAHGLTFLLISHNLAVVDHMSDAVGVMYLGRIVELSERNTLFAAPRHPYTRLLMRATPALDRIGIVRDSLAGEVPNPFRPPTGCAFHPRCPFAVERCRSERPELRRFAGGDAACHRLEDIAGLDPVASATLAG